MAAFGSLSTAHAARLALRTLLDERRAVHLPGTPSPLTALMAQQAGVPAAYVSGHALAASLGLPDIGLTTVHELCDVGRAIARAVDVPVLVDGDTGFGAGLAVARTIRLLEDAGVAGCHIEDQQEPKRVAGATGVRLVPPEDAAQRIATALAARTDPAFVLVARTDAVSVEGMSAALERVRRYADAGADAIFVEGLRTADEVAQVREACDLPLVVNVDELGVSADLASTDLAALGVAVVLHPLALLRLALAGVEDGLAALGSSDGLASVANRMQPPARLRTTLGADAYADVAGAP